MLRRCCLFLLFVWTLPTLGVVLRSEHNWSSERIR